MRSNRTILVVDDEVHIRRVVELKLRTAGYQVLTARNGQEGVDLIRGESPDAVITDITMPIIDGKQLCEMTDELKAERPFLTVIVTARIMPNEREWIKEMRDSVFMEKPFSPTRLLQVVDEYLGIS